MAARLEVSEIVPGSVLWLLSNTEAANARLRDYAAQRGIAPERLIFAPKSPIPSIWRATPWPICFWIRRLMGRTPRLRTHSEWRCPC